MNYNRVRRRNQDNSTRIHAPAPKVQGRNAEAVGRRANSEHSACNVTPHSAPSPDGMGVRLSHFGPPKLNSFKGLLNLSTSSPTTDPRPPARRGDRGCHYKIEQGNLAPSSSSHPAAEIIYWTTTRALAYGYFRKCINAMQQLR